MAKRAFMDYKRRYDPAKEGYGDAHEWQQSFRHRLGFAKAKAKVGDRSPLGILNGYLREMGADELRAEAAWVEIRSAYRKLCIRYYPALTAEEAAQRSAGDAEKFKDIQAAYEVLEHSF